MTEQQIIKTISALTDRVNDLGQRLDSMTNSKIEAITPYTVTKTAYIDDTQVIFEDVPDGNMTVYVKDADNNFPAYTVTREDKRVTVSFEACTKATTVTLSIIK